jgi:hypothetical protein
MTDEPYKPLSSWPHGISIKVRFEALLAAGHTRIAARALLTDWLEADNVETDPKLPRGWRIRFLRDGGITIQTAGGRIDPVKVLGWERPRLRPVEAPRIRRPMLFTNVPVTPASPGPAVATNEAAGKPAAGPPIEPAASSLEPIVESGPEPAESPPAELGAEEPELKAIAELATRLKPDNMVKREDYRAEIMKKYGVSAKLYDGYVWPKARERAGLPPKGSPGPKTQSGNNSRRD